jgi:hypothetical protein
MQMSTCKNSLAKLLLVCLLSPFILPPAVTLIWISLQNQVQSKDQLTPVEGVATSFSEKRRGRYVSQDGVKLEIEGYRGTFNARLIDFDQVKSLIRPHETIAKIYVQKSDLLNRDSRTHSLAYGLSLNGEEIQSVESDIRYHSMGILVRLVFASIGLGLIALVVFWVVHECKAYRMYKAVVRPSNQ